MMGCGIGRGRCAARREGLDVPRLNRFEAADGGAVDEFWVTRDELMELYSEHVLEYEEANGLPPPAPMAKATKGGKRQTKTL